MASEQQDLDYNKKDTREQITTKNNSLSVRERERDEDL